MRKTWNVNPTLKHLCTSASKHNREGKKKQSKPNVISYFAGRYVFCIQNIRFRCSMTFTLVIKRNLSVAGPDLHIRVGEGVHTLWWEGGGWFQNFFVFGPNLRTSTGSTNEREPGPPAPLDPPLSLYAIFLFSVRHIRDEISIYSPKSITSKCLTSPFHWHPSSLNVQLTTKACTSRRMKLSGKTYIYYNIKDTEKLILFSTRLRS